MPFHQDDDKDGCADKKKERRNNDGNKPRKRVTLCVGRGRARVNESILFLRKALLILGNGIEFLPGYLS